MTSNTVLQTIARSATRFSLLWLLLATVFCWLPYFSPRVVPFHDSAYIYECFHSFYSEGIFARQLVRWLPYGNYGMQADLAQCTLTPTAWVVGVLGLLFDARDTLALAKVAELLDEALYVFGLYLLTRELYSRRSTQWLITMAGALSVSWLQQAFLNLNVFYLLPLVMYFLVRFLARGDIGSLYLAGLVEVCSLIGGVPYFAPLHVLVLTLFAAPLCGQYPHAMRMLLRPRSLVHPGLWTLVAVAIVIASFLLGGLDNLASLAPDRDAQTGRVTLETFLNYGRPPVATTVFGFATGGIPHADNTYYVGLFPLVVFGYALFTVRDRAFFGIASAFGMLCWLSIGGVFASAVYHFPGMGLYRHIGLVFGIAGLFLLLGSGFGIDRLSRILDGEEVPMRARTSSRAGWLALVAALIIADFLWCRRLKDDQLLLVHPDWLPFFGFRLSTYLVAAALLVGLYRKRRSWKAIAPVPMLVLGAACILDLASFRAQVFWSMPVVPSAELTAGAFEADRISYLTHRSRQPQSDLSQARLQILTRPIANVYNVQYAMLYGFARIDPCHPACRIDLMSKGTSEMIRARGGEMRSASPNTFVPDHDEVFDISIGCAAPKLRLTRRIQVARTESDSKSLFAALSAPNPAVVLFTDDPQIVDDPALGEQGPLGTVQVEEFSSNRIGAQVSVAGQVPAWLVYADSWHPGWKARIDGREAPIVRANLGFKAVRVDPGLHRVEFAFKPRRRNYLARCHFLIATTCGFGLCGAMLIAAMTPSRSGPQLQPNRVPTADI